MSKRTEIMLKRFTYVLWAALIFSSFFHPKLRMIILFIIVCVLFTLAVLKVQDK